VALVLCWVLSVPAVASAAGLSVYVTNETSADGSLGVSQYSVGPGGALAPLATPTVAAGGGPAGIAVSPNGQYVYVVNENGGGVSQYSVRPGGALAPLATPTVATGVGGPAGIAVSPNGEYVYVTNNGSDGPGGVSQYSVGPGGALAPMATPTVAAGNEPEAVAVSPNGQYVYVTNANTDGSGGISQYTVGAGGGLAPMATPTVAAGDTPERVAVSPNGQYVYVVNEGVFLEDMQESSSISQYTVGPGGALRPARPPEVAAGDKPAGVAVSPNGQYVYVVNALTDGPGGVSQYSVGPGGALAPLATPTVAAGYGPSAVAVSPNGQYVYVTNANADGSGGISQYTVGAGGGLAPMATSMVASGVNPDGIAVGLTPSQGPGPPFTATVSNLRVSPLMFSAAGRKAHGRCVKPSKKNKRDQACQLSIKLEVTYTLNGAASVSFRLVRETSGRRISGRCVKASRKNKHDSKCLLLTGVQRATRSGVLGSNSLMFIGGLAAGTYELLSTPAGGTSQTATFRVTG
jgi:DNA-binding beta-propeller fold protein YncE